MHSVRHRPIGFSANFGSKSFLLFWWWQGGRGVKGNRVKVWQGGRGLTNRDFYGDILLEWFLSNIWVIPAFSSFKTMPSHLTLQMNLLFYCFPMEIVTYIDDWYSWSYCYYFWLELQMCRISKPITFTKGAGFVSKLLGNPLLSFGRSETLIS